MASLSSSWSSSAASSFASSAASSAASSPWSSAASSPASVGTYSAYGRDPALHTIDDEGDDEPDEEAFGQIEFGVRAAASPKPLDATGTLSLEELAGLVI